MNVISIVSLILGIASLGGLITFYAFLYKQTPSDVAPQFESIVGTVLIGSIVLSVLTYLSLIQTTTARLIIPLLLTTVAIFLTTIAFAISS